MPDSNGSPTEDGRGTFLSRALNATNRGLKVVPLRPAAKIPLVEDWPREATKDEVVIRGWARQYPEANCGAVTDAQEAGGTWILDIDSPVWFLDACPVDLPDTFVVKTGGGGLQFHFKHDGNSRAKLRNRSVENPNKKAEGEKETLLEILWDRRQGLVPGCVHPNGGQYEVFRDREVQTAPPKFVDWLLTVTGTKPEQSGAKYLNSLKHDWNPEVALAEAGLKFQAVERDGKMFFNYHVLMGKCLVSGALHSAANNRGNNSCCAFVYRPDTREFWHQCFDCGTVPGQTAIALRALGLELKEIVDGGMPLQVALAAFKTYDTLDATPLTFLIDGLVPEEGITGVAGLSGHFKTWVCLSMAKALITGNDLWNTFKILNKTPVMYLIPESGDRGLRHRLTTLKGQEWACDPNWFVCRTFTEGITLGPRAPEVLAVAVGRVVFLDTTIRFIEGDESSASDQAKGLASDVLGLLSAGAKAVVMLHHSPKAFRNENEMYLENVFRGTGDIGAMLAAAYGVRAIQNDTVIHIECLKDRDFEGPKPWQLRARPDLQEKNDLGLHLAPGIAGMLSDYIDTKGKPREKLDEELAARIKVMKADGIQEKLIAKKLGVSYKIVMKSLGIEPEKGLF